MKAKMITHAVLGLVILTLLATTPALAQKGAFEIGLGGGLTVLDDKLGGDTGLSFDLRAGYFLTDRFEIEIQNFYASSIVEGAFSSYTLNAVYHFEAEEGPVPYILAGVGTADVELDALFVEGISEESTALRAAVGGRFGRNRWQRTSIRAELSALNEDSFDSNSTHVGATIVISWFFGG
jgi:opacity protein-like surface antigen